MKSWWRAFLGALLTMLIVVPYMMGSDLEKYVHGWTDAINQRHGKFHLELLSYHRHWLSSDGDLAISGNPLPNKIVLHFKAYHGPLFLNAGGRPRLGLGYFKGTIDHSTITIPGQVNAFNMNGPIQLTALVPYFSDREVHATLPPITLIDQENSLSYLFNSIHANLDGDGSLQLELPSLIISRLKGSKVLDMDNGLLRILPDSHLASLSFKQIQIHFKEQGPATINNFLMQAHTQNNKLQTTQLELILDVHFDQLIKALSQTQASTFLDLGPFEFNLDIGGLNSDSFLILAKILNAASTQKDDLTPEQGEALEKSLANIFTTSTLFELHSKLYTNKGEVSAQFNGGFNTKKAKNGWSTISKLVEAFYTQGSVHLTADLRQTLSEYAASQKQPSAPASNMIPQTDLSNKAALPLILGFFKQSTEGYSTQIDIHDGLLSLNGKKLKSKQP